jgi:hypothetical protein
MSRCFALVAALASAVAAGCQNAPTSPPKGPCAPTVEGAATGGYAGYQDARSAFTRSTKDGSMVATLEDVSWLRFEGDEEELMKKHRPYFEQGYTTFEMSSFTKDFVQPTSETFVLEDSAGARVTSRPISYNGTMGMENERYAARFSLSFRHSLTKDLGWIRLTRVTDGLTLEWVFPPGQIQAAEADGRGRAANGKDRMIWCDRTGAAKLPKAQPLYKPRSADLDPSSGLDANGRPVNLITHPEAAPAYTTPVSVPPPAPALPSQPVVEMPPPAPIDPAPPAPPVQQPVMVPTTAPAAPPPSPGALPPPKSRRLPPGN